MVRIGVVGAGIWGTMHARAYAQDLQAELVAICDVNEERAYKVAEKYGIPSVFSNVDDMLDLGLDGISVATPDDSHAAIVLTAAAW